MYYNRFRYYAPEEGVYTSQDPVRFKGGDRFYSYVHDTNAWVDVKGLWETAL
ncbi:RHS repeat-associated core domain-containing protein [Aquimarina sp. M1]